MGGTPRSGEPVFNVSSGTTLTLVWSALLWGLVAASSLLIGAGLGVLRSWRPAPVGVVLGFGAGALVAGISFELAGEGFRIGGALPLALGLAAGAIAFFFADRGVARLGGRSGGGADGLPLALGAFLDGIPEQAVLGIGLAEGGGISLALLMAVFVSNLPEAIGSATEMDAGGRSRREILRLWTVVGAACALATGAGYLAAQVSGDFLESGIDGFAAGALLVMLVSSMIPDAQSKAKDLAGLAAVLGFALAAGLSAMS